MKTTGLLPAGLDRLHCVLSGYVERGDIPGIVALVGRGPDVHVETLGTMTAGGGAPMKRDAIFRIASITKPITAVAAMILVEECRVRLDDSIEPWLPELADRRVLRSVSGALDDTVPATRAITLRDLLTYRMGFGSVMAMPGTYPIQDAIRDLHIGGDGPPHLSQVPATGTWIRNLGSLPWLAQPGERWMYQVSADVLGVLVARVSGQSFGAFLRERIFEPLGMKDTAFWVPPEKIRRLPVLYRFDHETRALELFDGAPDSELAEPPAFESGAGGLVSTIDDYSAFARTMLDRGRYTNGQILSRASVELMTSDHLTPAQREDAEIFFGSHGSWGLGMAVDITRDHLFHVPGRFGWDGGFGTSAWIDPSEGLIGILLTQRMMDSPEPPPVFTDFWTTAYAAMV